MLEIILTIGLPASGKDTWALEQMKKYPGKYKRITKDLIREMLDDSKFSNDNEKLVLTIRDHIVEKSLNKKYSVIVSDTNFPAGGKHYQRMCEIAQKVGNVRVWEKYFDVDIKECKRRNSLRQRIVPEDIIDKMFNKYIKGKPFQVNDVYFPKTEKIKYDNNLPDCVIFDIDNTLAHMNGRSPYDWNRVCEDSVDENIKKLNEIIYLYTSHIEWAKNIDIFIFTGRDGSCLEQTKNWLDINGIYYDSIFIRPEGNMEKDSIIKKRMYDENIKGKYNVIAWIDDRLSIVEMARNIGLTVLQCNWGDF